MLHSLWPDSTRSDTERELDLAVEAGSRVVRIDITWGALELEGNGRWSEEYVARIDRFMNGASTRGLQVIATLWSSPCWASTAPPALKRGCNGAWWDRKVGHFPPERAEDYADAARFIAGRYRDRLTALEVWNEPNLEAPYGDTWTTENKAVEYVKLLRATYPAVKQVAPNVNVLAGAFSMADRRFLDDLYAAGMRGLQDGVSVHPYNEWRAPEDRWQERWREYTFLPGLEWIREGQEQAGEAANGIWITEFGWTTARGSRWGVSERQQASYIARAFALLDGLDYIKAATVYNLRAKGTSPSDHEAGFGLVRRDYSRKPAYAAVSAALAGAASPRSDGAGARRAGRGSRRASRSFRVRLQQRSGRLVATARVAPGRSVVIITAGCSGSRQRRIRVTAPRSGRIAVRVGLNRRPGCWAVGRTIVRSKLERGPS